ncbi:Repression factor of MSEs protein 1 [Nakaseomyces bracarensis]|uniref:Repression factor of MSEs protein 1 n=1 Tax=Nakaseomyces bracarensis TaxID=273131 RepID=A0ABR4NXC2_9SACH
MVRKYVTAPLEFRKQDIHDTIKELLDDIKPIEFESYRDYYLINTFKKGISASGRVNFDNLRSGKHAVYYQKLKRTKTKNENEESNDGSRSSSSGRSRTRSTDGESDDTDYTSSSAKRRNTRSSTSEEKPLVTGTSEKNFINGDISKSSILPGSNRNQGNVRRSSRLSSQQSPSRRRNSADEDDIYGSLDQESGAHIKDLYESLVEKVIEPNRRSDWVLPPRLRYQPEKQLRTKPVFDTVKINELIANKSIRNIMSRFEGGVAGVRKRDWE